ncbi:MAG: GtrA family protein [Bacillota bacterium]
MRKRAKHIYAKRKKEINYLMVGGWNVVFGYATFVVAYYFLSMIWNYIAILVLVNIITITMAYIGYKFFVFKTKGNYLREYLRFYVVYGTGFVVNVALFPVLTYWLHINAYISQMLINGLIIIMSFIAHNNFSFKS